MGVWRLNIKKIQEKMSFLSLRPRFEQWMHYVDPREPEELPGTGTRDGPVCKRIPEGEFIEVPCLAHDRPVPGCYPRTSAGESWTELIKNDELQMAAVHGKRI